MRIDVSQFQSLSSRLSIGGNGGKQSLRDNSTTEGEINVQS